MKRMIITLLFETAFGVLCGCITGGFFAIIIVMDKAYKQGQIDALTGNIKYHLVAMPDSTKQWEKR